METFAKDLQLAVRMLLKKPGFAVIAVLTLALGIAVNATMFSMVSAFLLRRPPGHDPQRIAAVSSVNPNPGFQADAYPVSAPNYLAWREGNHVFSDMAAAAEDRFVNLTSQGQSAAAGQPESLANGRELQHGWDRVITIRAVLQGAAVAALCIALMN